MKKIWRHNTVNDHKATQIPAFLSSLSLSLSLSPLPPLPPPIAKLIEITGTFWRVSHQMNHIIEKDV